jgi:hypothetical protein
MGGFESNTRGQISAQTVTLEISVAKTCVRGNTGFRRKPLREMHFNAGLVNRDRPFPRDVQVEILEIIVDRKLVFRRVAEFDEMPSARQPSSVRRDADIELVRYLTEVNLSGLTIDHDSKAVEGASLHALCRRWLNS